MWQQNRTRYSGKIAVDISHFRLWQRIADTNTSAIILEDDVKLTGPSWRKDLLTVLNELPELCGRGACCTAHTAQRFSVAAELKDLGMKTAQ